MKFDTIISHLGTRRLAACMYRRGGQSRFRDEVTVGQNGRVLFRRFNYGEAAGLVFQMWGKADGDTIFWDDAAVDYGKKGEAPCKLTAEDESGGLRFDGGRFVWELKEHLKSWPAGGLGRFKLFLTNFKGTP